MASPIRPISYEAFSFVCLFDPGDDQPGDPSSWVKASPLLDVTIPSAEIRMQKSPLLISATMSAAIASDPLDNRWFA